MEKPTKTKGSVDSVPLTPAVVQALLDLPMSDEDPTFSVGRVRGEGRLTLTTSTEYSEGTCN